MSDQVKVGDDGNIKMYKGYRLPGPSFFKEEDIEASINYRPLDGDIVLCAFPKTGNTWITYIIWLILHKDESCPDLNEILLKHVPFMERVGIEPVKALKPPRFYKNHFAYGLMDINEKAKYVYTYRRPEDTAVSFYHFLKSRKEIVPSSSERADDNFDKFFDIFVDGQLLYGDYFDHVMEAYTHKDDDHFLMVSYEDLKSNPRDGILRLAKFLGEDHYEFLKSNDSYLDKIVERTSFDYMSSNSKTSIPQPGVKMPALFRKGVVGDGKNTLTEQQQEKLENLIRKKMRGTTILDEWLMRSS